MFYTSFLYVQFIHILYFDTYTIWLNMVSSTWIDSDAAIAEHALGVSTEPCVAHQAMAQTNTKLLFVDSYKDKTTPITQTKVYMRMETCIFIHVLGCVTNCDLTNMFLW